MTNTHLNCKAEAAIERDYFRKGYMGTESATVNFEITDSELDVINNTEDFTLEAYRQTLDFEVDIATMKIYFSYSEESSD